jgi:hypothetical protein
LARAIDNQGFDWLRAFKRDYLPDGVEAKSTNVLAVADANSAAMQIIARHISEYAIVIVDLHEFRVRMYGGIVEKLRPVIPPGVDPYRFVEQIRIPGSNDQSLLRQMMISQSVVGRLESLMTWAANPLGVLNDNYEFEQPTTSFELIDREPLLQMDDYQFATLLGRVGSAIGDALSPERHAEVMQRAIEEETFFAQGYLAAEFVRVDVLRDKTFDVGAVPVLQRLRQAEERVAEFAQGWANRSLFAQVQRGLLDERSSQGELGLQAADIAAAFAGRVYESASEGVPRGRAIAVKQVFRRVFYNGEWL